MVLIDDRLSRGVEGFDAQKIQEILAQRTKALAGKHVETKSSRGRAYLACWAHGMRYAVPLAYLRSVSVLRGIRNVPRAPRELLGVAELKGEILSVVSLAELMGSANQSGQNEADRDGGTGKGGSENQVVIKIQIEGVVVVLGVCELGEVFQIEDGLLDKAPAKDGAGTYHEAVTPDMTVIINCVALAEKYG